MLTSGASSCHDLHSSCSKSWARCSDSYWYSQCPNKCGSCCLDLIDACKEQWFKASLATYCTDDHWATSCRKSCGLTPPECDGAVPETGSPTGSPTASPTSGVVELATESPTLSPKTKSPTESPILETESPTKSPIPSTGAPSSAPPVGDPCTSLTDARDDCKTNWFKRNPGNYCSDNAAPWWRNVACKASCCHYRSGNSDPVPAPLVPPPPSPPAPAPVPSPLCDQEYCLPNIANGGGDWDCGGAGYNCPSGSTYYGGGGKDAQSNQYACFDWSVGSKLWEVRLTNREVTSKESAFS